MNLPKLTLATKCMLFLLICYGLWQRSDLILDSVRDGSAYRNQAIKEIGQTFAGPQTVIGPVMVLPYQTNRQLKLLKIRSINSSCMTLSSDNYLSDSPQL